MKIKKVFANKVDCPSSDGCTTQGNKNNLLRKIGWKADETNAKSSTRLVGIEALRGWAALAVLMLHATKIHAVTLPNFLGDFISFLRFGVPLFFVISAFSLTYSYRSRFLIAGAIPIYTIRRIFRIAPLFYLMMLAWGWAATCFRCFPYTKMEYLLNLTFTFGLVPGYQNSIVPAGWSIGTEMFFYAIFPLGMRLAGGIFQSVRLLWLMVFISWSANQAYKLIGISEPLFYWVNPFTNLPYFGIGMLACGVFFRLVEHPAKTVIARGLLAGSITAGLSLSFSSSSFSNFSTAPPSLIEVIGWGLVFGATAISQALSPYCLITNRYTIALGTISFSLYLIHPFVFYWLPVIPWLERWVVSPELKVLLVWIYGLAIMIPIAYLGYRLIEVPGQYIGRRLSDVSQRF